MPSAEKTYQIIELKRAEDMLPIHTEWNDLVWADQKNSIFQTWEWVYYHLVYSNPNHKPLIITVRNSRKELVGTCPLFLRTVSLFKLIPVSILEFVGSGDSDYLGMSVNPKLYLN